jgi:hypothetical protein
VEGRTSERRKEFEVYRGVWRTAAMRCEKVKYV